MHDVFVLPSRSVREGSCRVDPLIELARNGDADAFERLAERHLPALYRLAAAMVGPEDARDVTQDALVAAWRELPRLRDPSRFESWLRSILMNRARNALRARRRHPTTALRPDHLAPMVADPFVDLHRQWAIEDAFGAVRPDDRAVLVLHYVLDLPLREVAEVLGVREGTAKSRLHAGLRVLRSQFPERPA